MLELEEAMMFQEVSIPVYFAEWSPHLRDILDDISHSFTVDGRASSAAEGSSELPESQKYINFTRSNL